jgi:hypothetical protein
MEEENFNLNNLSELQLPIGSDSFQELVTSDLFVDKSLFIKEIIKASEKAILITGLVGGARL